MVLRRLGIHDDFISVLKDCYFKASFFVEDEYGCSSKKRQFSGIRQGCPLSPYLFVLLMSVIDQDISFNLRIRNPVLSVQRVYYADDTILIATNTAAANKQIIGRSRESICAIWAEPKKEQMLSYFNERKQCD